MNGARIADEQQVRARFSDYEITRCTEHKSSGKLANGSLYDWHVYSVVARKN